MSSARYSCLCACAGAAMLGLMAVRPAQAQVTLPVPRGGAEDTTKVEPFRVRPPVSPLGAMARSLLLPGWGQSVLHRRVTGAVFVFWEGITLGMTLKSAHQLQYLKRADATKPEADRDQELIDAKGEEIQDWIVLLAFNHLFSAAHAYVAANLWDFPQEIALHVLPGDRYGLSVSVPLP